jgi:D-beta-D-heptose 7-phosphate kinase / D-beta-D-heptose 1-phosphate adenosyltransferase
LGAKGLYYADATESAHNFSLPSFATDVRDVSGAGDTVIAFAVIGLALGLPMGDVVRLANQAAAISVSKPHTAVVTTEELLATL